MAAAWHGGRRKATRCLRAAMAAALLLPAIARPGPSRAQPARSGPAFVETGCALPDVTPEVAARLRCGTVVVPRDYDRPAAGSFDLAVVVAKSAVQPAVADPVVYISGGPGRPLTIYADYQARHPYAPARDLILVDQRGTGRSQPRLCPELAAGMLAAEIAAIAEPTADHLAQSRASYLACRQAGGRARHRPR